MTAQTLLDTVSKLIEEAFVELDTATAGVYVGARKHVLEEVRNLWDVVAVSPKKSADVGNVMYVSKAEAYKYGRMEKLSQAIISEANLAAVKDISNLENAGSAIYTTQYDGFAWAYQQGYGLPLTGGAKVRLLAEALYSDFYGKAFDATVRENLGMFAQEILDTVTRALNQGLSYTKIASLLVDVTDRAYGNALRVARTEAGRIQSQAYLDQLKLLDELEVPYEKMWQSAIDSRTRASHIEMDGEYADKDGIFHLGDATGPAPRMTGVAKEDIHCRCTTITIIDGEQPKERRIRGEGIVPYETFKQRLDRGGAIPVKEVRAARKKM